MELILPFAFIEFELSSIQTRYIFDAMGSTFFIVLINLICFRHI
jgi:hypothetical protein